MTSCAYSLHMMTVYLVPTVKRLVIIMDFSLTLSSCVISELISAPQLISDRELCLSLILSHHVQVILLLGMEHHEWPFLNTLPWTFLVLIFVVRVIFILRAGDRVTLCLAVAAT